MPDLIPWTGGECPAKPKTLVEAQLRNGFSSYWYSHLLRWNWQDKWNDIVWYRIVK